jgi:hypothetical protein
LAQDNIKWALNKGLRIKIEKEKDHPTFSRVYIEVLSLSVSTETVTEPTERQRESEIMDSFSSHSSVGSGSPQISDEDLKDQLKNQLAQAYAQEFLEVYFFFMNLSLSLFLCASTIEPSCKLRSLFLALQYLMV